MVVAMIVCAGPDRLRQILDAGKLAGRGSVIEVRGKLIEAAGKDRVAVRRGGLGRRLQVAGDLVRHRLVLARARLLKLLEVREDLCEWRKLIRALCVAGRGWTNRGRAYRRRALRLAREE